MSARRCAILSTAPLGYGAMRSLYLPAAEEHVFLTENVLDEVLRDKNMQGFAEEFLEVFLLTIWRKADMLVLRWLRLNGKLVIFETIMVCQPESVIRHRCH